MGKTPYWGRKDTVFFRSFQKLFLSSRTCFGISVSGLENLCLKDPPCGRDSLLKTTTANLFRACAGRQEEGRSRCDDERVIARIGIRVIGCACHSNCIIISGLQIFRDEPVVGSFLKGSDSGLIGNRRIEGTTL